MTSQTTQIDLRLGPVSYRNWRAQVGGNPSLGWFEVPLYSDVHISGGVPMGLGPYQLINALPMENPDPAFVLNVSGHLDYNDLPRIKKTDTSNFTGAKLADEIACLLALIYGVRLMAGGETRYSLDERQFVIVGDRERPAFYAHSLRRNSVLPRVVEDKSIADASVLDTYPNMQPDNATMLVRAARSYRDAIWIADAEPELAWLLLVSALEVAAVQQQISQSTPSDLLRLAKPELAASLDRLSDPSVLESVADALLGELKATRRFIDFMMKFKPQPPPRRPPEGFQFDWSSENFKKAITKVYGHRSLALHDGVPFPPPMCDPPAWDAEGWEAPIETVPGLATSMMGGSWERKDLPFSLHTFEYVARESLLAWWRDMALSTMPQCTE